MFNQKPVTAVTLARYGHRQLQDSSRSANTANLTTVPSSNPPCCGPIPPCRGPIPPGHGQVTVSRANPPATDHPRPLTEATGPLTLVPGPRTAPHSPQQQPSQRQACHLETGLSPLSTVHPRAAGVHLRSEAALLHLAARAAAV